MKLMTEVFNEDCGTTTELNEATGQKSHFIEGIFMQGNLKNRNGRIYPSSILEREMRRYTKDFIVPKRSLGELDHPQGPAINSDRISHLITEMRRDGDNFMGKAKILSTPMGNIVKTFIDEGVKIGVSTRGLGSVTSKNGIMEVGEDFHLATVDVVTNPSGPDCFVNGIMENAEFVYDAASGSWRSAQVIEEIRREVEESCKPTNNVRRINRRVKTISEADALRMFRKFVGTLSESKLTNTDFARDLALVKAGKADASKMAEKWGARGGAFLNFIKK